MVNSIEDAVAMVEAICHLPGNRTALRRHEVRIKASGLREAITAHDTAFLYGWLMEIYSLQGISDSIAFGYIEKHGNADWKEIRKLLRDNPLHCSKLRAFQAFKNCGYRKMAVTCNVQELITTCVVPRLPLRKGDLNQLAVSLFLFIRDVCKGDLVRFIDKAMAQASIEEGGEFETAARRSLIKAFRPIFGIGPKLISMSLASILIAGGRQRPKWVRVGRSMIVIDSLVHNFFYRSGILHAYDKTHAYGPACYGQKGCETILRNIASKVDLKAIDPNISSHHPRLVQVAIWRFCGEGEIEMCNGRKIDDRKPCERLDCPIGQACSRVALFPRKEIALPQTTEAVSTHPMDEGSLSTETDYTPKTGKGGSGRTKTVAEKPRLQGDCDGLCGFYSIVNGIRLALEPVGGLSIDQEGELWRFLIRRADRKYRFATLFLQGTATKQIFRLSRRAAKMVSKLTGFTVVFQVLSRQEAEDCGNKLDAIVRYLLKQDRNAILAGIECDAYDHWSIIRGVTSKSIWLLDSDGSHRLLLKSCALHRRSRAKGKPRYRVGVYGTFSIA